MTKFIMNWQAGEVQVYLYQFSENSLEASHAVDMHFCVEHEPIVSDVYEQVEAAESLSHNCLTSNYK